VALSAADELTSSWDPIHFFEAIHLARISDHNLSSMVILNLINTDESLGETDLGGMMTNRIKQDVPVRHSSSHIANIVEILRCCSPC